MRDNLINKVRSWRCNGSIYPLLRNWHEVDAVIEKTCAKEEWDSNKKEARRWGAIALDCYFKHTGCDNFFEARNKPFWTIGEPKHPWTNDIRTIAQMVAKYGGTDSRAKCQDIHDLIQCIKLIGNYNDHNADASMRAFKDVYRMIAFPDQYGKLWNPNDGHSLYEYHIGWEGSHCIYVTARLGTQFLEDDFTTNICDEQMFKYDMSRIKVIAKPDEFHVYKPHETGSTIECRMWWD